MMFRPRTSPGTMLRILAAGLCTLSMCGSALAQQLLPDESRIEFVSKQMGVPVSGHFQRFEAEVRFDRSQPESAEIRLAIDTGSATLGIKDTDAELPKPIWFDVAQFPQAVFTSSDVKAVGDDRYEVEGELSIKGSKHPVTVPVQLESEGEHTVASGEFTIQRLSYAIGDGEWADTSLVADDVQVRFRLVLSGL